MDGWMEQKNNQTAIKIELLLPDHMMRQLTINYYKSLWHKHKHNHKNKKIN